ncbi:hypothetical protein H6F86_24190 [Phormidium sp. FACHB-592]|uniref:DUF6602 domain-containing protein n=1 Tax=Stenomitos frigidus AS-A4 TaxID=2933935 RepID=A0ABV0KKH2_9CYAN|nr:DUF6602 domain-containing protein [Phormidium sp. FACHB-592]MBD2076929.1 hypothetical protein [Phormidium sp. FACHB-592]
MRKKISRDELTKRSAEQTEELIASMNRLANWIEGAHQPSSGSYLESLISSHLKRRLPDRFSVSTGFLSSIETIEDDGFERFISSQFDILIWDSHTYPPLFKNDDFVIIMPQSCYAIIEVTNTLDGKKLQEDIQKMDSCFYWYGCQRQKFNPFTAVIGFNSSLSTLESLTERLFEALTFNHDVPLGLRYNHLKTFRNRSNPIQNRSNVIGFPNAICAIDKGLVYAEWEPIDQRIYVKYQGTYVNQVDSFGLFEKKLLLNIMEQADNSVQFFEYDLYSEFLHAAAENKTFFSILGNLDEDFSFDVLVQHDSRFQSCGKCLKFEHNQETKSGLRKGFWVEDISSGAKKSYGRYHKGKRDGLWSCYCLETRSLVTEKYKNGKIISSCST